MMFITGKCKVALAALGKNNPKHVGTKGLEGQQAGHDLTATHAA